MTQSGKNIISAQNQLNRIYLNSLQNRSDYLSILFSMKKATNTDIRTPVDRVLVASPNTKVASTILWHAGK
jgi:hypothetical protein